MSRLPGRAGLRADRNEREAAERAASLSRLAALALALARHHAGQQEADGRGDQDPDPDENGVHWNPSMVTLMDHSRAGRPQESSRTVPRADRRSSAYSVQFTHDRGRHAGVGSDRMFPLQSDDKVSMADAFEATSPPFTNTMQRVWALPGMSIIAEQYEPSADHRCVAVLCRDLVHRHACHRRRCVARRSGRPRILRCRQRDQLFVRHADRHRVRQSLRGRSVACRDALGAAYALTIASNSPSASI